MKKKYYAVKKGLTPGIYTDWDTCKAQVSGYPNAEYKGFATLEDAESYMGIVRETPYSFADTADASAPYVEPGSAVCYVDGSYRESSGRFSYGIVMFYKTEDGASGELRLSKAFSHPELLEMRNVSGEIMGAAEAMKRTKKMGLRSVTIYHDYEGIAKWPLGLWKANKPWIIKYKAFYDDMIQYIDISFVKVKGHSHDRYNDLADELARQALYEL